MFWNKKKNAEADDTEKQETAPDYGLTNNNGVNYFMVLAGGYLAYLGWKLLKSWYTGEEGVNAVVAIGFGVVFIIVGLWVVWRQWKAYKKHQAEEAEEAARARELEESEDDVETLPEGEAAEDTATEAESAEE